MKLRKCMTFITGQYLNHLKEKNIEKLSMFVFKLKHISFLFFFRLNIIFFRLIWILKIAFKMSDQYDSGIDIWFRYVHKISTSKQRMIDLNLRLTEWPMLLTVLDERDLHIKIKVYSYTGLWIMNYNTHLYIASYKE